MAVVTKDELMEQLKTILGDNTSDEALALLENVNDTFSAINDDKSTEKDEQIKTLNDKLEEQDKMWREKYRNAFFHGTDKGDKNDPETEEEDKRKDDETTPHNYDDLFKGNEA